MDKYKTFNGRKLKKPADSLVDRIRGLVSNLFISLLILSCLNGYCITSSVITFGSLAVLQRATTTNGISYTSIPLLVFAAVAQEQVTVHSSATTCPYSFTYLSFAALFSASPLSLTFGSLFKAGRLLRKLLYVSVLSNYYPPRILTLSN